MARRALVAVLGLLVGPCTGVEAPEDFVNALAGSFTQGDRYSTGNTFPVIARPWGFNHWSVMTNKGDSSWWFSGNDHVFKWLRCTHQPSPWIGDYGWWMIGPISASFDLSTMTTRVVSVIRGRGRFFFRF